MTGYARTLVHCVMHQVGVLGGLVYAAVALPASSHEALRQPWWDWVMALMWAVGLIQPVQFSPLFLRFSIEKCRNCPLFPCILLRNEGKNGQIAGWLAFQVGFSPLFLRFSIENAFSPCISMRNEGKTGRGLTSRQPTS